MAEPDPCQTCGARVRVQRVQVGGSESVAEPRPDRADIRICTNPDCSTNSSERSVGDVV